MLVNGMSPEQREIHRLKKVEQDHLNQIKELRYELDRLNESSIKEALRRIAQPVGGAVLTLST